MLVAKGDCSVIILNLVIKVALDRASKEATMICCGTIFVRYCLLIQII
jgi:hypothetical protein